MVSSLILGGTKGLGLALAWESHRRKIVPLIAGRSAGDEKTKAKFPPNAGALTLDVTDEVTLAQLCFINVFNIRYIFWVAGIFYRNPLVEMTDVDIDQMTDIHLRGPVKAIKRLHGVYKTARFPYHLTVVASTSSWRLRRDETLYCALKAAKAAFTRNFSKELFRDLPGSKVTLVNPGGMKTPDFWQESGQDITAFMDPKEVAAIIWDEMQSQTGAFKEIQIMRGENGIPRLHYGARTPELPE